MMVLKKRFLSKLEPYILNVRDSYVNFLLNYPWHVIALLTLISISLSVYSVYFHWDTFTFNPTVGFETRHTFLSEQRLALNNLIHMAAGKDNFKSKIKREIAFEEESFPSNKSKTDDYDDYGLILNGTNNANEEIMDPNWTTEPGACQQYFVLGSIIPYEIIPFMSKLILKVSSFNTLFEMRTLKRLCAIDSIVDSEIESNGLSGANLKRLNFSFNLPYYTMCLNMQLPSNSCHLLDADDIEMFKSLVLTCQSDDPPVQCQLPIAQQLSNMIFQKNIWHADLHKPMYIGVILPITLSFDGETNLRFYSNLLHKLQKEYKGDGLELMGVQFGIKDGLFKVEIQKDARLGALAILLVVLIVLIYTNSLYFTLFIGAGLILSIGVAFFIYTVIFGIKFFPFLNLLAMILVVAVGADDAFLFTYQYRKHKKEARDKWSPVLTGDINNTTLKNSDQEELLEYHRRQMISGLSETLSHAAVAMFVTSATTAVAFFANFASKIVVLRCFGIYAGMMMLINYILVITILPAAIVVTDNKVKSFQIPKIGIFPELKSRINRAGCAVAYCFDLLFAKVIPLIVQVVRIPLIPLALCAFAISIYAIVKTPGIRLPEKNSMQFLRSTHPYEWFDENAATLFDFSNGRHMKMTVIGIWGINPTKTGSTLIPSNVGSLDVDGAFGDALANHLLDFQAMLKRLTYQSNSNSEVKLWLDGFIHWLQLNTTSKGCHMLSGKRNETSPRLLSVDILTRCLLLYGQYASLPVFNELQLTNGDGPIFDKNGAFLAYFMIAKSTYNLSTVFHEMKPFFDFLDNMRYMVRLSNVSEFRYPLMLTSRHLTSLYDLLERILNGTAISVLISLVVSTVVIVLTTLHLALSAFAIICIAMVVTITIATVLWFGWTVNVVEATIIVLTIGMSFDYCLHFAVGFRLYGTNNYSEVASVVGIPVVLALISSFVAGLALVGASTQAFFEIGIFLMLMTGISFFVAVFVFPSMVSCFLQQYSSSRIITRL